MYLSCYEQNFKMIGQLKNKNKRDFTRFGFEMSFGRVSYITEPPETSTRPKYIHDPYLVLSMPAASPAPDGARQRAATPRSKKCFPQCPYFFGGPALRHSKCRDHFVQTPSQWEMLLPCNAVFQFAGRLHKIIIEKKRWDPTKSCGTSNVKSWWNTMSWWRHQI